MIIQDKNMITLIYIGKFILNACMFWFGIAALAEGFDSDVFINMIETMPSRFAIFMGGLYVTFIVAKKGVDLHHYWQLKKMERQEKKESVKRAKIHTDSDLKNLNKKQ